MINSSLIPLIQNKLVDLNETINLREHQGFNAALQVVLSDKGKRITDDIRTDITNMENEENNLLANRAKQLEAVGNNTIYTITIGILIASLVTALSIIVINNRTNRKHLEEKKLLENEVQVRTKQLHESNEQLKVHDKMQKEFINVAAHELRTPVQPILGLSDVLLSKKGNIEQYKKLLDVIKRNAKRLHRLTEDILDITKIESQSLQLRKQRINLNEVILGVIAEYASQIKKAKNVNLSFISKDDDIFVEAYSSLKEWMDFRTSYGEKIIVESWLMRDIWQTTNVDYGAKWGLATNPKKLKSSGIKRLLERALWEQGIRQPLKDGEKRHEWKAAHGFRKFYKSHAEQVMKPINVEITMGHNIGLSASYYKPKEKEVLEDYIKAVDLLTISSNNVILQKEVAELQQKSKDNEYVIRGKLQEKDEEMKTMKEQFNTMQSQLQTLISTLSSAGQEGKQEIAKKLIEQGSYKAKSDIINKGVIF